MLSFDIICLVSAPLIEFVTGPMCDPSQLSGIDRNLISEFVIMRVSGF